MHDLPFDISDHIASPYSNASTKGALEASNLMSPLCNAHTATFFSKIRRFYSCLREGEKKRGEAGSILPVNAEEWISLNQRVLNDL